MPLTSPVSLTQIPQNTLYKKGDVFVLFGELFGRGYVTGLLDQAKKTGMEIIGITVGRRDENNKLRPLTEEELAQAEANLGGRIINVPAMAGFDLDSAEGEPTPTDLLGALTLENWETEKLDWAHIEKCRQIGVKRFQDAVAKIMAELEGMIADGKNVHFAHTMAGGIPKAKVFLVIANRIYKGRGARHMSSQVLLESDLGKLILQNFDEVSANTFRHLIEGSAAIRARIEKSGGQVRYSAYGYHGTGILIGDEYRWQTYTNYTQGYAKMKLEAIAEEAFASGIKATVFNCPEIRTNSSDVFAGIELPLLPLLKALKKENGGARAEKIWADCQALLVEGATIDDVLQKIADFQVSTVMEPFYDFNKWPMPNSQGQSDITIGTSTEIAQMHKDAKALISDYLSVLVVEATGALIFGEVANPSAPVLWLNHDVVARQINSAG
ncbi:hypothetical protein FJQ55_05070 [Rhizobium glycinendophyticum]|uniref:Uncharacterized protein n=1 Tax=Rhizobium glycinendophyticum TaxID=2589807 RepID=A0A504UYH5_9HYPH|nr:hypothetical protein FJQ55_05070 [Rhizobium glycinendophyticum]